MSSKTCTAKWAMKSSPIVCRRSTRSSGWSSPLQSQRGRRHIRSYYHLSATSSFGLDFVAQLNSTFPAPDVTIFPLWNLKHLLQGFRTEVYPLNDLRHWIDCGQYLNPTAVIEHCQQRGDHLICLMPLKVSKRSMSRSASRSHR